MKECEVLWKISTNEKKTNKQNEMDELTNIHLKIN